FATSASTPALSAFLMASISGVARAGAAPAATQKTASPSQILKAFILSPNACASSVERRHRFLLDIGQRFAQPALARKLPIAAELDVIDPPAAPLAQEDDVIRPFGG